MRKFRVIHPFMFAVYPVLYLYSQNIANTQVIELFVPLTLILCLSISIFLLFRLMIGNWHKAGYETSLILLLFFSYGHIYANLFQLGILYNDHRPLAIVYAVVFILGVWAIWRVLKNTENFTKPLNLIAVVLVMLPIFQIIIYRAKSQINEAPPDYLSINQSSNKLIMPDIYYLVLDGYGRGDVLDDIYNFDNREFLDFLEDNGFYVAHKSHSNYTQTLQSLSSTLNMNYLDQYQFNPQNKTQNDDFLVNKIFNNSALRFLESFGYKSVSIASGWSATEWETANYYYSSRETDLSNFTYLFYMTTPALIFQNQLLYDMHRQRILFIFDTLQKNAKLESPKFIFAHFIAPHPPFVFGPNGELVQPERAYNLRDGNFFEGTKEEYIDGYRDELVFINDKLMETISEILEKSSPQPIIIIQGDHGPAAYFDWSGLENNTCLLERTAILNAYLFPGNASYMLYQEITPVNSFRILLSAYFGAELELLPDITYYSSKLNYDFMDITDSITCSIP